MAPEAKTKRKFIPGVSTGYSPDVKVEKVVNTWGSSAGAGSDCFHIYRKLRFVEADRLRKMDEDFETEKEQEEHAQERQRLKAYDEQRTQKKREKRKRRQLQLRQRKQSKVEEVAAQADQTRQLREDKN